jgi:hypothetical protein
MAQEDFIMAFSLFSFHKRKTIGSVMSLKALYLDSAVQDPFSVFFTGHWGGA